MKYSGVLGPLPESRQRPFRFGIYSAVRDPVEPACNLSDLIRSLWQRDQMASSGFAEVRDADPCKICFVVCNRLPVRQLAEIVQIPDLHRSEEHTSELQSRGHLVCRLLLEKKKYTRNKP